MTMDRNSLMRLVTWVVLAASVLASAAFCAAAEEDSRWVHPLCQPLSVDSNGPFVELADGSLMTIDPSGDAPQSGRRPDVVRSTECL